ncbi:MAG: hypothetical protein RIF32_22760 [Leptospirales bacterium]|jgi:hypothetical protein
MIAIRNSSIRRRFGDRPTDGRGKSLRTATPVLAGLLALATIAAGCDGDASKSRAGAGGPGDVPTAAVSAQVNPDGRASIRIDVPSRHHAYLDAGEHGNLIPIGFDWQGLTPEPKTVQAPAGEHDEEVKAQVLRGSGTFVFEGGSEQAPTFAGRSLRVRSQICDEDKGICYRPTWTEVSL